MSPCGFQHSAGYVQSIPISQALRATLSLVALNVSNYLSPDLHDTLSPAAGGAAR
jgi:hypothetical protein